MNVGIEGGNFDAGCDIQSAFSPQTSGLVNGMRLTPENFVAGDYRVVIKGNFIRDAKDKALDADHLPGWVPKRKTGDGVAGGTFESWFTFKS